MTKIYYYNCPIKALYMSQEFGVLTYFEESGQTHDLQDFYSGESGVLHNILDDLAIIDKFYVAKESEEIFKPKEDDKGIYLKDGKILFANFMVDGQVRCWIECRENAAFVQENVYISLRGNKHFIDCEVEND